MGLKQPMMYEMPPPPAVDPEVAKKEAEAPANLEAEKKKALQKKRSKVLTQSVARKVTRIVEAFDEAGTAEDWDEIFPPKDFE